MFSADNHGARRSRIEIITRPGTEAWRSSVQFDFRDAALNARDAYSPTEPPEQRKRLSFSLQGPLVRDRTSVSLQADASTAYESQTIRAASQAGLIEGAVRQPEERVNVRVRLQHALAPSHSARLEYDHGTGEADNLGVGDVNLPERAYSEESTRRLVRLGITSTIGRGLLSELRLQAGWRDQESVALSEAPTVRVLDAVTIGGANINGGRTTRDIDLTQNLSLQAGRHAIAAGGRFQLGTYRSDAIRNLHGTFTFASLADHAAGRPQTYTLRRGDPTVEYSMFQGGWFIHDDVRIRRNLTLGVGLRHEWQSHVDDVWNLSPRIGFAWSPFGNGRTSVRGGAGIFYDWYDSSTHEETVQVDGTRVQELTVRQPGFPDPFSGGTFEVLPQGRVQASSDLRMPTIRRVAIGVERRLGESIRVSADYEIDDGRNLLRGRNVNAPGPNGERPDPAVGNVIEIRSIGREKRHEIGTGISARLPWRGLFLTLRYNWQTARDDGDGPLSLPASNIAPDEWGPAGGDIRHRVSAFSSLELPANVQVGLNVRAASAPPYNITTGRDGNGDTVFNDRPEGVGRNAGRGEGTFRVDFRVSWRLDLGSVSGGRRSQEGPGRGGRGGGARRGRGQTPRVSTEVYLRAFNLLNTVNRRGFRGVQLSPFFGKPTSSEPARRIEIGTRIRF
jgi:hypothetical protein